jgi:uncharacterized membrane protein
MSDMTSRHQEVARRRHLPFQLSLEENDKIALHIVYALYGASIVFGVPSVLGVILAYLKLREVRGSWLESHAHYQIGTFWGIVVGTIVTTVLAITFVLIPLAWITMGITWVWFVWRTLRGWYRLSHELPA